ncbi:MAG: hypothetical protein NTU47_00275 [Ignavibacteriales bacterium]|nr:hypothetical protein [Ignavibacteriales bacterium]
MKKLMPTEIKVGPNYSNPFSAGGGSAYGGNPETIIPVELPKAMEVKIFIYDILGREVRILHDGMMAEGRSYIRWDGTDGQRRKMASGAYLYRVEIPTARKIVSGKIMLVQ